MDAVAWRRGRLSIVLLAVAAIAVGACTSSGAGGSSAPEASEPPAASEPAMSEAPASEALASEALASEAPASPIPGGLLDTVLQAGTIKMSTDPQYPPQSELTAEGEYQGFDIDVGTEIAKRLGVEIAFETPSWDVITAGSWGGRWDFSVGSMTITSPRQEILDFSDPYYFTPAQMAARADSGITTLDGLAGKVVCVGSGTTYLDWLSGTLDFGTESPQTAPPEGATSTTQETDRLCAEAWKAGRTEFDGWLSSSTTVQDADRRRPAGCRRRRPGLLRAARRRVRQERPGRERHGHAGQRDPRRDARGRNAQGDVREVVRQGPDREAGRLTALI